MKYEEIHERQAILGKRLYPKQPRTKKSITDRILEGMTRRVGHCHNPNTEVHPHGIDVEEAHEPHRRQGVSCRTPTYGWDSALYSMLHYSERMSSREWNGTLHTGALWLWVSVLDAPIGFWQHKEDLIFVFHLPPSCMTLTYTLFGKDIEDDLTNHMTTWSAISEVY